MLKTKKHNFYSSRKNNFFVIYELDTWSKDSNSEYFLEDCLFGSANLSKNSDLDKYVYSGYGTGFDLRSEFALPDGSVSKNVIIFGVDMSWSVDIDNKEKDIFLVKVQHKDYMILQ